MDRVIRKEDETIILEFCKRQALNVLTIPSLSSQFNPLTYGTVTIFVLHRFGMNKHGVHGHSPQFLDECLNLLRREGYHFVSLREVVQSIENKRADYYKSVCFTIDDGFLDQAVVAAPIFQKYNCPVSISVITGFLDGELWPWDDQVRYCFSETAQPSLSIPLKDRILEYDFSNQDRTLCARDFREICKALPEHDMQEALHDLIEVSQVSVSSVPPDSYQAMQWNRVKDLEKQGVSFVSHGVSHMILSRMSASDARHEINRSWERLSSEANSPLKIFCFPTGRMGKDFGLRELKILSEQDFKVALSTDPGYVDLLQSGKHGNETVVLDRLPFPDTKAELLQYCSGMDRFKKLYRRKDRVFIRDYFGSKKGFLKSINYKILCLSGAYRKYAEVDLRLMRRLIFICKGNICRSPFAESVAESFGIPSMSYGVETRGGAKADDRARLAAETFDVDLGHHRTRRIEEYIPLDGDLIIGMEPVHLKLLHKKIQVPSVVQESLLGVLLGGTTPYIHDPYGGGEYYFQHCFRLILNIITKLSKYTGSDSSSNRPLPVTK